MSKNQNALSVKIYKRQKKTDILGLMKEMLKDLFGSHFLALQFAKRDISAQYRQSYLGILWMFITPVATALVWIFLNNSGTVVISDTGMPYPVYVFSGTLIWSIILDAINSPTNNTNSNRGILSKINFPKEALILSGIYKLLFNSSIKIIILLVFIVFYGIGFHWSLLLFPLFLIFSVVIGTAIGLFLTPIGLLYSDISRLVTMMLSIIMYLTPVVYGIPESGAMKKLMEYNPLTAMVTSVRAVAVGQDIPYLNYFLLLTGGGLLLLLFSLVIFRISIPIIIERLSA
jgi:lipopolysaccharide transport system permease protein